MIDIAKNSRLRQLFIDWKGEEITAEDEHVIATAIAINDYVSESNLETIKTGLVSESGLYLNFHTMHKKRSRGAAVYGMLALMDYYHQRHDDSEFVEGEGMAIQAIVNSFEALFSAPFKDTSEKFTNILSNINNWLDNQNQNNTNPILLKELLLALYTMFQFGQIKLSELGVIERTALWAKSIQTTDARSAIEHLLTKTEEKLTSLEQVLTASAAQTISDDDEVYFDAPEPPANEHLLTKTEEKLTSLEQVLTAPAAQTISDDDDDDEYLDAESTIPDEPPANEHQQDTITIEDYFDTQWINILKQGEAPLQAQMSLIDQLLNEVNKQLRNLIDENVKSELIQNEITKTLDFLTTLKDNEQKATGKLSTLDIINKNQAIFNKFIQDALPEEQQEWEDLMKQLKAPSFSQQTIEYSAKLLNVAFTATTYSLQSIGASRILEKFTDVGITTVDSECKTKLKSLAKNHLSKLQLLLKASQNEKEKIAQTLVQDNQAITQCIITAIPSKIEQLITANDTLISVIAKYNVISTDILRNQKNLKIAQTLDTTIDTLIDAHGGFLVELSLLLSKILSLFKTDIAAKIEESRAIKSKLQELKCSYTATVEKCTLAINNDANNFNSIKDVVITKVTENEIEVRQIEEQLHNNSVATFGLVKTFFTELNQDAGGELQTPPNSPRFVQYR